MPMHHFPLFFFITTGLDSHVVYWASDTKLASRRSLTACSATSIFSGDCFRLCYATTLREGLAVRWYHATSGSRPGISVTLQANKSALSFKHALSWFRANFE